MTVLSGVKTFEGVSRPSEVLLGIIVEISDDGPQVAFLSAAGKERVPARTAIRLTAEDVGAEVVLAFEAGDLAKPLILGLLQRREVAPFLGKSSGSTPERVELTGAEELTLRCGKASITLTRSGKIILRGTYISSRSSGVIRIKGGSVQIN